MIRALTLCLMLSPVAALAQSDTDMTPIRMAAIVLALDPDAQPTPSGFEMTIDDVPVLVIVDATANRMRAMVPIRLAEGMTTAELTRVMQANFDSALDARYALANGRLWGVFIHSFAELQKDQLISGLGQTVNIAKTYGTLFTGGTFQFGAGDSGALQRELLDDLLQRGQDI